MKKHLGLVAALVCVMIMVLSGVAFADTVITQKNIDEGLSFCRDYPVALTLDGEIISFYENDVPPVIITPEGETAGRTLIPVRALFEAMGAEVFWMPETESVEVFYEGISVILTIGSAEAMVDGESKALEVPALIIDHDGDYYGSTMIPVRFTAESIACTVGWDDETRTIMVESPKEIPVIDSRDDDNEGDDNGDDASVIVEGFEFPVYDMDALPELTEKGKTKIIAIDMGHGGKDCGAIGHEDMDDEVYEKDINLAVGLSVRDMLTEAGASVYMLRETDIYYTLLERADMANIRGADFFVSFHNNSSDYSTPHGTEVYYYAKTDPEGRSEAVLYGIESKRVAAIIQKEMVKALGTLDRGIKNSPKLAVLNKTYMPAVIVEGAFLSNEDNFKMMKTEEYAKRYSYACTKAIIEAINEAFPD